MHHYSLTVTATLLSYCMISFCFCHANPSPTAIDFTGNVAINCGFNKNSVGFDGREWIADQDQVLEPKGKSTTSSRGEKDKLFNAADPVPYMTARISNTQFSYTFQVKPGQKFIRLHFYPSSSYRGFENFLDLFTVEAGSYTLLRNFSASLATDNLGVTYLVKEFCLNVEKEIKKLRITFTPYQSIIKLRKTYAFVNGIEIISMPTGLYYTPDGDSGAPVVGVGQKNRYYYIDNSTAIELVQRLNIGGSSIPPGEDFGMFRGWSEDSKFLQTSKLQPVSHLVSGIKFTRIPAFTAPLKIYQTSWEVGKIRGNGNHHHHYKLHNFTWKIPVDVGFAYLLRLHFCDFEVEMSKDDGEQRKFSVLINNNQVVVDMIRLISTGVPIYSDYLVILKGHREAGKFDLLLALQSSDDSVIRIFHGLEIFKLSNSDNNLASPNNNIYLEKVKKSWKGKIKNLLLGIGRKNTIATVVTILIISLNIIVFKLRQLWAKICYEEKHNGAAATSEEHQYYYQFSLDEIISATHNFSDKFLIGSGGFGNVYKGLIYGASKAVAIKRLKSNSKQGAHEFWTEIEALSKIRHVHLVSLIGYCNEHQEMILVYEYMPRGTLADNLYRISTKNGKDASTLTWEQRLGICIGAARGLEYLHTGVKYGIIHRDVKDSNILLDQNLVAKVSDFGLSKMGEVSESLSSVSTKVKGTWGYLDPDYLMTHKLTRKTDVYAFGVVLLVVICGKPAVDRRIKTGGAKTLLVSSFRKCITKREFGDIIDPSLQGKIPSESFSKFLTCIESCLHNQPKKRPTMAQVVASLEHILEGQPIGVAAASSSISFSANAIGSGQIVEVENLRLAHLDQSMVSTIPEESTATVKSNPVYMMSSSINSGYDTNLQSPQLGQSMRFTIFEEIPTVKVKSSPLDPEEVKSREVFQSRQRDHSTYVQKVKPLWVWRPWEALWKKGIKPVKKNNLGNGCSSYSINENVRKSNFVSGTGQNFSIADIRAATDNLNQDRVILNDDFMIVYTGFLKKMKVSIYRFKTQVLEGIEEFQDEIETLSEIRHENLAFWIGYCYHETEVYIVYESTDNAIILHNSLYYDDDDDRYFPLSWNHRLQIVIGVAQGLHYLHSGSAFGGTGKRIIHGDLKPKNIFLTSNNNLTTQISNSGLHVVSPKGYFDNGSTLIKASWEEYYAPEVFDSGLTEESDVYSFGLVLLEVLCCRRPVIYGYGYNQENRHLKQCVERCIRNKTVHEIIDAKLMKGQEQVIAERCLAEYLEIAFSCLVDEPIKRPSMIQVYHRLKFALYLQVNGEAIKGIGNGKDDDEDDAVKVDHIYQGILKLVSNKQASSSSSNGISPVSLQTYEQNMSQSYDQLTVAFSR